MSDPVPPGVWSIAFRQWQGARAYQEDDFGIVGEAFGAPPATAAVLMVLADGMGGEAGGARASRIVVEAFTHRFSRLPGTTPTRLNSCLDIASDALEAQVRVEPELEGMGSTVVAALYDGRSLTWLSVGDSPMWMFSGGRLTRLNADHSMAPILDRMVETGELSSREALADHRRHMLRSAVTGDEVELIDCSQRSCRLEPGEYLVLASDGLDTVAADRIEHLLGRADGDADKAADALMAAVRAANRPHQDNVTLLVLAGVESGAGRHAVDRSRTGDTSSSDSRRVMAASLLGAGLVAAVALIWWQILNDVQPPPETATEDGQPAAQPAAPAPEPAPSGIVGETPAPQGPPTGDSSQAADPESASSAPSAQDASNEGEGGTTTQDSPAGESPPTTRPTEGEQGPGEPASSDPGDPPRKPAGRTDPEPPGEAVPDPSGDEPSAREESPPATKPEQEEPPGLEEPASPEPGAPVPESAEPEESRSVESAPSGAAEDSESAQDPAAGESAPATQPREEDSRGAEDPASTKPGDALSNSARYGDVPMEKASHGISESARSIGPVDRSETVYAQHRSDPNRSGWRSNDE